MGEEDVVYTSTVRDHGNGVENYECDGCRADRYGLIGCGDCPHNKERIAEYNRKYIY